MENAWNRLKQAYPKEWPKLERDPDFKKALAEDNFPEAKRIAELLTVPRIGPKRAKLTRRVRNLSNSVIRMQMALASSSSST